MKRYVFALVMVDVWAAASHSEGALMDENVLQLQSTSLIHDRSPVVAELGVAQSEYATLIQMDSVMCKPNMKIMQIQNARVAVKHEILTVPAAHRVISGSRYDMTH